MKNPASILIANRGEIASRIVRTCRKMGIRSIAVYSDADRNSPFVHEADVAVSIGGNTPGESYLDSGKIILAAQKSGAEAVHPGYGFLSENAQFALDCAAAGLLFIGPHADAIAGMGSKSAAKGMMRGAGVPVVPGYDGGDQRAEVLHAEAGKIGYPVLLKAVAGGGGKGMRIVHEESEFYAALIAAKTESLRAFGDDQLLIEKYFPSVRHIEFQIFGDRHGNAIHLMERECTIQRRYQKIIEESPSPALSVELRAEMAAAAVKAAKTLNYDNAGTVEFILTTSGAFYFLEVNTRLQVEHPVTEMVTGLDLVEWQIRMASGERLPLLQSEVSVRGYAVECRLYAENPAAEFRPDTGEILRWHVPQVDGLRVDSGVAEGGQVSTFYDPMLAKVVVWASTRDEAHRKMGYALAEMQCLGLQTNRQFLLALVQDRAFQAGAYDTHFLQHWDGLGDQARIPVHLACIAALLSDWHGRESSRTVLSSLPSGWRNQFAELQFVVFLLGEERIRLGYRFFNGLFSVQVLEQAYSVRLVSKDASQLRFEIDGIQQQAAVVKDGEGGYWVQIEGREVQLGLEPRLPLVEVEKETGAYLSPMPAQVLRVLVEVGEPVAAGASLLVISSMKMENTIVANSAGIVAEIYVRAGQNIEAKAELLRIDPLVNSESAVIT